MYGEPDIPERQEGAGGNPCAGDTPVAAIIGMGFLGTRIAAEMLLLGTKVQVYDRELAALGKQEGQQRLDAQVWKVIAECEQSGLLSVAGAKLPPRNSGPWQLHRDEEPARAMWSANIAEACQGVDIVIEAVPDIMDIKTSVFREAVSAAPQEALLATSTLTIPLASLHEKVAEGLGDGTRSLVEARLLGLRFLAPVVYIAFAEVTVTSAQAGLGCRDRVLDLLNVWGKSAFACDVQGAADGVEADGSQASNFGFARLRLDTETASRRQAIEAKVRGAHREGPEAVAGLSIGTEKDCCICLSEPAAVKSVICGHVALCQGCAEVLKAKKMNCPLCRARFMRDEGPRRISV